MTESQLFATTANDRPRFQLQAHGDDHPHPQAMGLTSPDVESRSVEHCRARSGHRSSRLLCRYRRPIHSQVRLMNFFKATIATAAVITCCLGNEMPARADLSRDQRVAFHSGKDYGYALGLIAASCTHYAMGQISRDSFRDTVRIANELDETTPAIRRVVVKNITTNSGKFAICNSVVRSVMGTAGTTKAPYRNADNWY